MQSKHGILATKIGMTQLFLDDGVCVPVTVLKVEQNIVLVVNDEYFDKLDAALTEGKRIMRLSDVDHFSVLTDFDKNTWKPVFTEMTYQEALAFGKTL